MPRIVVIFNCQHDGICRSMRALRPRDDIVSFGYPALSGSPELQAQAMEALHHCDVAIIQPMTGNLSKRALHGLKTAAPRNVELPAVTFGGFHPDAMQAELGGGATHALHSRITVAGFLRGLDPADTAALFNRLVFRRLGYFDRFALHRSLLTEKFRNYDIAVESRFENWMARGCFMHSPNHPKIGVLLDLARLACERLGLDGVADVGEVYDSLANGATHPVYPDLAESLGVPPEEDFHDAGDAAARRGYTKLEFIEASFAFYATVERGRLLGLNGVADAVDGTQPGG